MNSSTNYLTGTGGWAYFPTNKESKLKAYSKAFSFVEVNYTFYEYPETRKVQRWRRTVPNDFTFSVRCHQDLTHRIKLRPTSQAYHILNRMLTYCKTLEAPFLVLATPSSYEFTTRAIKNARELVTSAKLDNVQLVWENRSPLTGEAKSMMQDLNIVQSTDLSVQESIFPSEVVYTRLFGKGKHNIYQFSDEELEQIADKISAVHPKIAAASYHGVRMNTDALRFAQYQKSGTFPQITPYIGVESARTILVEDTKFPSSKQSLIDDQGWKVFDATVNKRIHLSEWLSKIPNKTYHNINEVTKELEVIQ